MQAMQAFVRQVVRPPYQVSIKETRVTEVFEGEKLIDKQEKELPLQAEWRVDLIVYEDFVGEKPKTVSCKTKEEADRLVVGAVAYHF